jgi:hypothetical protein
VSPYTMAIQLPAHVSHLIPEQPTYLQDFDL